MAPLHYPRGLRQLLQSQKSLFLFGPRQTGKSTLLKELFPQALYLDLLSHANEELALKHPEKIGQMASAQGVDTVIIDEIARAPSVLNEVHRFIEEKKNLRFILTGSSTRKLYQSGTNMLGGRAGILSLCPITFHEFVQSGDPRDPVQTLVQYGGLPSVLNSSNPQEVLRDYVRGYIYGEIRSETNIRSLDNYARFLDSAALMNAEQMNFSEIASDAQLPVQTVKNYFQILEDTLLGQLLLPYRRTTKRKAVSTSKFYLFDLGVHHAILSRWNMQPGTLEYGNAFEHFLWRELLSYLSYQQGKSDLFYWRTTSQKEEVDFVLQSKGQRTPSHAIEVKAKDHVMDRDLRGLLAFAEEFPDVQKILVCLERKRRMTSDGIEIWPVAEFLTALWAQQIIV